MRYSISTSLIAIALVLLAAPPAYASAMVKPPNSLGLVGYWPMNEGTSTRVSDFSGNGNTGTLTSTGSTLPTWVNGKLGKALQFDGSTDYVSVASSSSLSITSETLSAWVYIPGSIQGTPWGAIFQHDRGGNDNYGLFLDAVPSKFHYRWANGGANDFATVIVPNTWYHVVGTYDASTFTATEYLNGVLDSQFTGQGGPTANGQLMEIGSDTNNEFFNGIIDELRIYNRALSATEVANLYKYGAARVGASSATLQNGSSNLANGLVAWWTMDGADVTDKIYDRSGQGNNGYFTGSATSSAKVAGKLGQALFFNGINNKATTTNITATNSASGLSVAFWVKPSGTLVPSEQFVSKYDAGTGNWGVDTSSGCASPGDGGDGSTDIEMSADYGAGGDIFWCTNTNVLKVGVWTHVIAVYDGTKGNIIFYINGVQQPWGNNDGIPPATTANNSLPVILGGDNGGDPAFHGALDDVRIYNYAISSSTAKQLYLLGGDKVNTSSVTLANGSTLKNGLVGHWTFDGKDTSWTSASAGTTNDLSGKGNTGTLTSMSQSGSVTPGKLGQAFKFDGSSQYVSLGNGLNQQGDFTVAAWAKPKSVASSGNDDEILVRSRATESGGDYEQNFLLDQAEGTIFGYPAGNYWRFQISAGCPSACNQNSIGVTGVQTNQWTHLVGTYNSTSKLMTLYINGQFASSTTYQFTVPNIASMPVCVGAYDCTVTPQSYFPGSIDDVRVYNRALTAAEVKQLYLIGK